jgi:hypothetical protein
MSTNSSIEREDRVVSEVLVVLGEMGREDLVGGLKEVIGDFNNRILNLVVENVNLDSCNTDLMLEIKDLERDVERLERDVEYMREEIGELQSALDYEEQENGELMELVEGLRAGERE